MGRGRWRHGHDRRARSPLWAAFRGIYRRVIGSLVLAAAVGFVGGALLVTLSARGLALGPLVVMVGMFVVLGPLGWFSTLRIARPVHDLADLARELRAGRLSSRDRLPEGPAEVEAVGGALRELAERLGRQLKDQRALLAAVSHELRSPLGRARVLVEMSREGSAPPTLHDDLQAEIDAMDELVGDLLAAARIDFEAVSPRRQAARDLALRALQIARLPEGLLRLDDDVAVSADPTLAARALSGLLDNGQRYGGRVTVLRVRRDEGHVRFEVEDDGPGFGPGEAEQAFQPFWRGATRRAAPGEGLGLALVRQIAQAHGGLAGAEPRAEGGARVWVALPEA